MPAENLILEPEKTQIVLPFQSDFPNEIKRHSVATATRIFTPDLVPLKQRFQGLAKWAFLTN